MSQENVELVRRFFEAGQRSVDAYWENPRSASAALQAGTLNPENEAVLAFLDPEVEYSPLAVAVEGGVVRGHLGWLKFWDDLMSATEEFESTINELTDLGGDQVLAGGETTFKWKGSGIKLGETRFLLVTVRDGLIVRMNTYREREEVFEAARLSE
jgi:ketosteroid isomerase-like protein